MSNDKVYKVSSEDLDKVTKAINIVSMLMGKIALSNMLESAELPDPSPATRELTVEERLEVPLDRMEEKAHRCHCHRLNGENRTVSTCQPKIRVPAPKKPLPRSMKEIAAAAGVEYKKVQKYAYTHGIGTPGHTLDGHQCRIFTEKEVKVLLKHFKK